MILAAYTAEVNSRGRHLILDPGTSSCISQLAQWLINPSHRPGLLLCGPCGNGKTTIIRALRSLCRYIYMADAPDRQRIPRIVEAKEIVHLATADTQRYRHICDEDILCIDDLGIEPSEVLDYGNVLNPTIDLICHRYNEQLTTIITTNLTPDQIHQHYGDRIADRFREMLHRIIFTNPSYRTDPS